MIPAIQAKNIRASVAAQVEQLKAQVSAQPFDTWRIERLQEAESRLRAVDLAIENFDSDAYKTARAEALARLAELTATLQAERAEEAAFEEAAQRLRAQVDEQVAQAQKHREVADHLSRQRSNLISRMQEKLGFSSGEIADLMADRPPTKGK